MKNEIKLQQKFQRSIERQHALMKKASGGMRMTRIAMAVHMTFRHGLPQGWGQQ